LKSTYLWDCEEANPAQYYESHGIEPAANVGQEPKRKAKLDGVQNILNLNRTWAIIYENLEIF